MIRLCYALRLSILVTIGMWLLFPSTGQAQQNTYADSILTSLKRIEKSEGQNSANYREAIDLMNRNKKEILLDHRPLSQELDRIKPILTEKEYYGLILVFYRSHFNLDSIPNESLIRFGKDFIEANKDVSSPAGKSTLHQIIRGTRLPFRNLGLMYEGITYYTSLGNYFVEKNDKAAASIVYSSITGFYSRMGIPSKAEYYVQKSLSYLDDNPANDTLIPMLGTSGKANRYLQLAGIYLDQNLIEQAEKNQILAIKQYEKLRAPELVYDAPYYFLQMARVKTLLNSDSSLYYFDKASDLLESRKKEKVNYSDVQFDTETLYAWYYLEKGKYFLTKNQNDSAAHYFVLTKNLKENRKLPITSPFGELRPNYYAATLALQENRPLQAIQLLGSEIQELKAINGRSSLIEELELLAKAYASAGLHKEGFATQQELLSLLQVIKEESDEAQSLSFEIEKKMQEDANNISLLKSKEETNEKIKYYFYGITALLGLFALTLGFAIVNKQKSNSRLTIKNQEVTNTLDKLRQTQAQLIQSEKMASLGELTAGIAHEIQNPLNFVNNFSEVSAELVDEIQDIRRKTQDKATSSEEDEILEDIKQNLEKINHHGKRADAIVKGMLEHSRTSSGEKVLTDLNALADEYLRLSYHGMKAKDNSFNADFVTDFDPNLPKINVVPQEIGRVLLNIINNAFQATNDLSKGLEPLESFQPMVTITSKNLGDKIEIKVSDNGPGILSSIKDKIFQPFFTTKPTGQGTGLGLSLSYDIVKAHGGELKVETKEGEGSEFIIQLPLV
ncbi:ATP-binding protein [Cognataquiflexum aquatile]|uniref:ATP-binding protein n=1 Tax=Cognataquiflexum aquatile TaxID=2249427 RepID=UPI001E2ABCD3|nr:ATP-binding protein [Cognataquiflexum aquatile]